MSNHPKGVARRGRTCTVWSHESINVIDRQFVSGTRGCSRGVCCGGADVGTTQRTDLGVV